MGCLPALLVGKATARGKIAAAVLPDKALLAALFNAALVVIVLWIVGTALPVQLAFQATFGARIGLEFLTERYKMCLTLAWHNGDRRGAKIQPDHLCSYSVLGFPVGETL